jgi:hypothetical protein
LVRDLSLIPDTNLPASLHHNASVQHEASLIGAFVKRNKRERYREMLSNPRQRHKFISLLAHFSDFDPQYRAPLSSNKLHAANIALELLKRHSPSVVFAISENPALDQKELPLVEVLKEIVGYGMGTVLSCIPGQLAFVETEDERYILERHDPLEKHEYIRFMVDLKDADSNVGRGIFQAAALAVEWRNINGADAGELGEENHNRPPRLRSLRRRMATRRRALPRRHAAEKVASETPRSHHVHFVRARLQPCQKKTPFVLYLLRGRFVQAFVSCEHDASA